MLINPEFWAIWGFFLDKILAYFIDLFVSIQLQRDLGSWPSAGRKEKLRSRLEKKRKFSILARPSPRHRLTGQTSFTHNPGKQALLITHANKFYLQTRFTHFKALLTTHANKFYLQTRFTHFIHRWEHIRLFSLLGHTSLLKQFMSQIRQTSFIHYQVSYGSFTS